MHARNAQKRSKWIADSRKEKMKKPENGQGAGPGGRLVCSSVTNHPIRKEDLHEKKTHH